MDHVRFVLNGQEVVERDAPPTTTLLRYLRGRLGLTGTKEGCAEGDCGACTVVVADLEGPGGPGFRAINACLLLLPMVHGRRVWTVEGLARNGVPHPVQAALVEELGSQCGYCTPGVVMSLFEACYRDDLDAGWKLDDQLAGNLCRCTGYRPIRDAARRVAGLRPDDAFLGALGEAPARAGEPLAYAPGDGAQRFFAPTSLAGALDVLGAHPEARVVAGATDLGLEVTKRHARFPCLLSVERVAELQGVRETPEGWSFGAALPLARLEAACERALPVMARMLRYFGARQIKNRGTLGGNVCNASPIGDTPPVLLALDATLVAASRAGERRIPAADFFVGYRRTALAPGELLARVEVPRPPADARTAAFKVSKRRELDISAVCAAFCVRVDGGGRIADARAAFGGMAAVPARARRVEAALVGQPFAEAAFRAAADEVAHDFQPIDDHRGSAWYRAKVARNLVHGLWWEVRDEAAPALRDGHAATVQAGRDAP